MWWAVWSIWRGDRAKLSRIAGAIEDAVGGRSAGRASVTISVLDDVECYPSFRRFSQEAPAQTTQEFDSLRIDARGSGLAIRVCMRRTSSETDGQTGVVLTVERVDQPAGDDDPADARRRVAAAVTRGALNWRWAPRALGLRELTNYKPTEGEGGSPDGETRASALRERNSKRFKVMLVWTWFWLLVISYSLYAAIRPVWEASLLEGMAVFAGCFAAAGSLGRVRYLQNIVLPAIEIAEMTPGRRAARRLVAVAAPAAAAVARALFG
jgi:hypothetical protein